MIYLLYLMFIKDLITSFLIFSLAPQVQRQLRETQELIKDCSTLYGTGYATAPTSSSSMRSQPRAVRRPPSLDTQYSQELS